MAPVTSLHLALIGNFICLPVFPTRRTTMRRIYDRDLTFIVAHQNRASRVVKAVTVTHLHHDKACLHRIQNFRAAGGFTAMLRHQQQLDPQRRTCRHLATKDRGNTANATVDNNVRVA